MTMTEIIIAVTAGMIMQGLASLLFSRWAQIKEVRVLRKQVRELQEKVTLLESAHQDAPFPSWLKDTFGVMLAINSSYEKEFLLPRGLSRSDYLYKSDYEVWPDEIAKEYILNDRYVLRTKQAWQGYETIVDHHGNERKWRIIKWPRRVSGVYIGIAGVAIPPD